MGYTGNRFNQTQSKSGYIRNSQIHAGQISGYHTNNTYTNTLLTSIITKQNETFNNLPFNLLFCKSHRRHGDRTFECDQPDTCKMAGITVQRQPKNELPSPRQ